MLEPFAIEGSLSKSDDRIASMRQQIEARCPIDIIAIGALDLLDNPRVSMGKITHSLEHLGQYVEPQLLHEYATAVRSGNEDSVLDEFVSPECEKFRNEQKIRQLLNL